jgi:hypothetical protein
VGQVQCSRAGVALRRILLHSPGGEGDFGLALGKQDENRTKQDAFFTKTRRGQREKGKTERKTGRNRTPSGIHFHSAFLCRTFAMPTDKTAKFFDILTQPYNTAQYQFSIISKPNN